MDEATREGMERYKAALERIRSGESDSEEVELSSGRVRLTPDGESTTGIRIEVLEDRNAGASSLPPESDPRALVESETEKGDR